MQKRMSDGSGLENRPRRQVPLRWLIFVLAIVSLSNAPLWGPVSFVALGLAVIAVLLRLETSSRVLPYIGLFVVTSVILGSLSSVISLSSRDITSWRIAQTGVVIVGGSLMFVELCVRIVADIRHGSRGRAAK